MDRIVVETASKRYTKYTDAPLLVTRALRNRTSRSELWALRDVDLCVGPGECVGVIGRNGSGKSTLLRLLAGVTAPTTGRVTVRGRIAPLLSVGVGFHPELSGRENVYVTGTILGLGRRTVEERLEEIVAFADIGNFLDTPVKFYSSGMFVRLGFAVSVLAEPDIMLVDEVLAVGDIAFQLRCFERMSELRAAGTTLVLVSHNLQAIRWMCDRVVVLHDGVVRHDGETAQGISLFHDLLAEQRDPDGGPGASWGSLEMDEAARIERVRLRGSDGTPSAHIAAGERATVEVDVEWLRDADDVVVGLNVHTQSGVHVSTETTPWDRAASYRAGTRTRFTIGFTPRLATGSYAVQVGVATLDARLLTRLHEPVLLFVDGRANVEGFADLDAGFVAEPLGAASAAATDDAPTPT